MMVFTSCGSIPALYFSLGEITAKENTTHKNTSITGIHQANIRGQRPQENSIDYKGICLSVLQYRKIRSQLIEVWQYC